MTKLTWDQVNTWRLGNQGLLHKSRDISVAIKKTGGVQSQVLSASYIALQARTRNLTQEKISKALYKDHTLIRTWAMRNTLHILLTKELPMYSAARSFLTSYKWNRYFEYYGFTKKDQEAFLKSIPEIVGREPITKKQLGEKVSRHTKNKRFHDLIVSSNWGGPLKPSAHSGDIALAQSQGTNTTFINPKSFNTWKEVDPEFAAQTILRRFMEFNGPTRPELFVLWWGGEFGKSKPKALFESMKNEFEEVEIDGWQGYVLKNKLNEIIDSKFPNTVSLLPLFDIYTFGLIRNVDTLLPSKYKQLVYRPQGWISAVVLINGYIRGVWDYKKQKNHTLVSIKMFEKSNSKIKEMIKIEVEHLREFLQTDIKIVFS